MEKPKRVDRQDKKTYTENDKEQAKILHFTNVGSLPPEVREAMNPLREEIRSLFEEVLLDALQYVKGTPKNLAILELRLQNALRLICHMNGGKDEDLPDDVTHGKYSERTIVGGSPEIRRVDKRGAGQPLLGQLTHERLRASRTSRHSNAKNGKI